MSFKRQLVKKLETYSRRFLSLKERKKLLDSLKKEKLEWISWKSKVRAVLKNLDTTDGLKFSALLVFIEKAPKSKLFQNKMEEFLIERVQFWKHYDFGKKKERRKVLEMAPWVDRVFKLLTSKSFIRLLIIFLIIAFIIWFYIDRAAYLEFIKSIIKSFFQAIR